MRRISRYMSSVLLGGCMLLASVACDEMGMEVNDLSALSSRVHRGTDVGELGRRRPSPAEVEEFAYCCSASGYDFRLCDGKRISCEACGGQLRDNNTCILVVER